MQRLSTHRAESRFVPALARRTHRTKLLAPERAVLEKAQLFSGLGCVLQSCAKIAPSYCGLHDAGTGVGVGPVCTFGKGLGPVCSDGAGPWLIVSPAEKEGLGVGTGSVPVYPSRLYAYLAETNQGNLAYVYVVMLHPARPASGLAWAKNASYCGLHERAVLEKAQLGLGEFAKSPAGLCRNRRRTSVRQRAQRC